MITWTGTILEINDDNFEAKLVEDNSEGTFEYATINSNIIKDNEKEYLKVGACFKLELKETYELSFIQSRELTDEELLRIREGTEKIYNRLEDLEDPNSAKLPKQLSFRIVISRVLNILESSNYIDPSEHIYDSIKQIKRILNRESLEDNDLINFVDDFIWGLSSSSNIDFDGKLKKCIDILESLKKDL